MYTLKQIAQRGTAWGGVAAFVVAAVAPLATPAFADDLNPLTDRSLTLSSSAPGWDFKDGSGNTKYAQPNSGANGQKTGNTFDFKVSSSETVKAMTFQYCTTSAGDCEVPGDDVVRGDDTASTSDLNVVTSTPTEVGSGDFATVVDDTTGLVKAVPGFTDPDDIGNTTGQYAAKNVAGNFVVFYDNGSDWAQSEDWTMTASNEVTSGSTGTTNNFITLKNTTGQALTSGQQLKVVFFGTDTNYITNPGSKAFFVKINTYDDDTTQNDTTRIDGGVTVANIMNHSIRIQTKVLETMQFSVGTVDPTTLDSTQLQASSLAKATHGVCDTILTGMEPGDAVNVLKMGNQTGEDSLEIDKTYSTHSYWRLSSNSSAGATVYYSGVTLSNTVGDKIAAIGPTKAAPAPGGEQFGLALAVNADADQTTSWEMENTPGDVYENGADMAATGLTAATPGIDASTTTDVGTNLSYHDPQLAPLVAAGNYDSGAGAVNLNYAGSSDPITTAFAFDETSNSIPVPIATEDTEVVDCVTGKMRYAANIAATTPAGIYTTAINYIASPQY